MIRTVSTAALLLAFLAPGGAVAQDLKIYISSDMEGVAGAVTGEQLGPSGFEYGRFREFVTEEVNAAIRAARAAGATEIVVSDSHGNGQNLLLERLPQDVTVVRSWPRPLMMMEGVDETFDAALLLGYHASTTNPEGVRAHTISSATLAAVRLNGREMSEAGLSAAIAGHFGVPVVMVSGDDAAVEEARGMIGSGVDGAVVKWNLGFHSARTLLPEAARRAIGEAALRGIETRGDVEPFRLSPPYVLDLTFKSYMPAQVLAYLPNVERVDAHTVRFEGQDMPEVSAFLEFAMTYSPSLTP